MLKELDVNIVIGFVIATAVLLIVLLIFKRQKNSNDITEYQIRPQKKAETTEQKKNSASKETISKLPQNKMFYQILSNNQLTANDTAFNFNYLLDEIISLVQQAVLSDKVELLFNIDKNIPSKLFGSPKRLSRILVNLIENSVKYSENGVVQLHIGLKSQESSRCMLTFEISDEGKGMNTSEVEALFTDPTTRATVNHTPLGFYVAKELVAAEKSKVTVQSRPDVGTRVLFELTFGLKNPDKEAQHIRVPSQKSHTLRVAVIEAYQKNAELMREILKPYVSKIDLITNEKDIIQATKYLTYDLVIADHRYIDEAVAERLKSNDVEIVLAQSVLEGITEYKADFAVDYLISKPFTQLHIKEMLMVLYGEAESTESEQENSLQKEDQAKSKTVFDTFISDAEIPVTRNITKTDFKIFDGAKVLVVEDNQINQRVIKGLLGDSGISLSFAENGLDALDVVEEESKFDLILMDINMPVLDGIETTRRIRQKPEHNLMPIVAFTGLNLQDQIERMRDAGMNAHMAKPLNIGRVYSVFNQYLPKQKAS